MPRLRALPDTQRIKGFKGVIDFAVWRGVPYSRKWPKTPRSNLTPDTLERAALFTDIIRSYSRLAPELKNELITELQTVGVAPRDYYLRAVYGRLHTRVIR